MTISISTIQRMVCAEYGITHIGLLSDRRERAVVRPRQVAYYLCRELTTLSLPAIAKHFFRDHSCVHHGAHRMATLLKADKVLAERVERIRDAVIETDGPPAFPATLVGVPRRVSFHMGGFEQAVHNGVSHETVPA
jgi:transposase InsO family protein